MSASELVKSRPVRSSGPPYRPIAPVSPIPVVEPPPKAKRGRKPNPGSKSAREALRKESHSRIEKRRREKINETLTTLRELIAQDEAGTRQQHSPPPGPEREFKLELLERTVIFVRGLLDKTRRLEEELRELQGDEPPRKRKKIATPSTSPQAGPSNVDDSVDDIELDDSSVLSEPESPPSAPDHTEAASPRVFQPSAPHRSMSIAALLSPSVAPVLPSPPPSGHLKGPSLTSESQMETLSLPSPGVMFRRSSVSSQRTSVPVEEADDTAAAALLLQFSSKTPMSVLGMHKSEKYNQD